MTLLEIQDRLRQLHEVCRSYDGGDRPQSPPAFMLREIADLEREYREGFDALWVPTSLGERVIAWSLQLDTGPRRATVIVHRLEPAGQKPKPGWWMSMDYNFRPSSVPVELDASDDHGARVEGVTRALKLLEGTARDLRMKVGYRV